MNISAQSSSVGEYPGLGMKIYSVFKFSFFDLSPVCIVNPNRLKCEQSKMMPFIASSLVSKRNAASST